MPAPTAHRPPSPPPGAHAVSPSIKRRPRTRGIIVAMGEPEPPAAARAAERPGDGPPDPHACARAAFLRLLVATYLAACVSLWLQVEGLIGSHGILPYGELLELGRTRLGLSRYWVLPTVLWVGG